MAKRRQQRQPHNRRRRPRGQKTPPIVRIGLILFFAVAFGMLVQQAVITGLDRDVNNLQSQVEAQQAANDSKEGKVISGRNLDKIEEKARAYGMTEPKKKQYQYVVVKENNGASSPFDTFKTRVQAFVKQISGDTNGKTVKQSTKKSSSQKSK